MPPCLTLSIIRYVSRVKWSNPGKGVAPSPTPWYSCYWKGKLRITLDCGHQQLDSIKYFYEIIPYTYIIPGIGMMVRVFTNGPGDLVSILGRVIPKTQKMVLDTSLLNIQLYKVWIKGKVEQSRERSSTLLYTLV